MLKGVVNPIPSTSGVTANYVLTWDGSNLVWAAGGGGGGSPLTTKGDLFTYTTAAARLAVGTNGQVLSADSAEPTGLKWIALAGGGDALTSNPLSQFASTTSSQLAGVISDKTGSGSLVFATSPTLVTPVLGVATATSINGATITSGTLNGSVTGTNTGDQTITLTGDVTGSGTGSFAATIANGAVGTAKLGGDITTAGKALLDDADASAQRTTLSAAARGQTWMAQVNKSLGENVTEIVISKSPIAGVLVSFLGVATESGTITAAVKINGTDVTGMSAINITSTSQDVTASGANTIAIDDRVTIVFTANSSAIRIAGTLNFTRTLA